MMVSLGIEAGGVSGIEAVALFRGIEEMDGVKKERDVKCLVD